MTHPRGSGAWWNEITKNVMERAKVMATNAARGVAQSGYPPLTLPVTLTDLKKMPPDEAKEYLRDELARTTSVDANGEMVPNGRVLDLISGYLSHEQEAMNG